MDNYQLYEDPIGKGQNSIVYKSRYKKSITYYAIKCVPKSQRESVTNQVRILNVLNHVNIMHFYSWYETNNHFWIILEYCAGGDLLTLLNQDAKLPESTIRIFATDIVNGMQHVHANGFLYGDLKPSNILLNGSGMLKLADFGMAQQITILSEEDVLVDDFDMDPKKMVKAKRGTPAYMSPELFQGAQLSTCSDFWALGCVLYQMATGSPPFVTSQGQGLGELMEKIIYEDFEPLLGYSADFVDLVTGLLRKDPAERYSWKQIRNHSFFMGEIETCEAKQDYFLETPEVYKSWSKIRKQRTMSKNHPTTEKQTLAHEKVLRASIAQCAEIKKEREHGPSYANDIGIAQAARSVADVEYDFEQIDQSEPTERSSPEEQYVSGSEDDSSATYVDIPEESYQIQPAVDIPESHSISNRNGDSVLNHRGSVSQPVVEGKLTRTNEDTIARLSMVSSSQVQDLLFIPADSYVKPIANNPRIEPIYPTKVDESAITFSTYTLEEVSKLPQGQLEAYLTTIYKALVKSQGEERVQTLNYFESLCKDTRFANLLINSSMMKLLMKIARGNSNAETKHRIFNIMGLLLRFASIVSTDLMKAGLYDVLLENTQHESLKVSRKATATLGELLFYVATQPVNKDNTHEIWTVPNQVISGVIACTKWNKDEIIQHYAVKTIENICGHSKDFSHRFTNAECVANLAQIFQQSKNELLRATVLSTLSRMAKHKTSMAEQLISTLGVRTIISIISNTKESNLKSIQYCLNIINLAFLHNPDSHTTLQLIEVESQKMISSLMKLIDHSNAAIRGKAILSTVLLFRINMETVVRCCDERLCEKIEKILSKDTDAHSQQCMNLLIDSLGEMIVRILKQTLSLIDDSHKVRVSASRNKCVSDLNVVLTILTSPGISQRTANENVVQYLSKILVLLKGTAANDLNLIQTLLSIVEMISQQFALSNCHSIVVSNLLPTMIYMFSSEDSNTRFLSLKIFTDILIRFLSDSTIYNVNFDKDSSSTQILNQLIITQLLPQYERLLVDVDPIPLYALKLLNNIVEQNLGFINTIKENHPGIILTLFHFFRLEHKNNNVHNVRLMLKIIISDVLPLDYIHQHDLITNLIAILDYSIENGIESFFEPSLKIVDYLLYKTSQLVQICQTNEKQEPYIRQQANTLYEQNEQFCQLLPVFSHLCCHKDYSVAEASSHILLLLSRLYSHIHKDLFREEQLQDIKTALVEYRESSDSICPFLLKMILLVIDFTPVLRKKVANDVELCQLLREMADSSLPTHQNAVHILKLLK